MATTVTWQCEPQTCHPVLPCFRGATRPRVARLDDVAWYSATRCHAAQSVIKLIAGWCGDAYRSSSVWDAFGGSGADAIAFLLSGMRHVTVTELDPGRAASAMQRLSAYAKDAGLPASRVQLVVGNSVEKMHEADIVYADPPWGGPAYKGQQKIVIRLGNKTLGSHVAAFRKHARSLLVLKLPYNYDYDGDKRVLPKTAHRYQVVRAGKDRPDFDIVVSPARRALSPPQMLSSMGSGPYSLVYVKR